MIELIFINRMNGQQKKEPRKTSKARNSQDNNKNLI
jgi:hypothetical protein